MTARESRARQLKLRRVEQHVRDVMQRGLETIQRLYPVGSVVRVRDARVHITGTVVEACWVYSAIRLYVRNERTSKVRFYYVGGGDTTVDVLQVRP